MTPDTSAEAVERLARNLDGIARQTTTYNSLDRANAKDAAATLRALAAERDAQTERSRVAHDALRQEVLRCEAMRAERDRLADALRAVDAAHAQAAAEVERLKAETAALVEAAGEQMRERAALTAREACLVPPDGGSPTVEEVQVCDEAEHLIRNLPLPTPSLGAIRAQARREGMEVAAKIAETDRWARTQKQIATAIRAAMEQEDGHE